MHDIVQEQAPAQGSWPAIISGDYQVGVVRLATLCKDKINHLLFASVELLPAEMPGPPDMGVSGNFADYRLVVARTVLPLAEALAWFERLKLGQAVVPGKPFPITSVALGSEPNHSGFNVHPDPPPFSPVWHNRPRLHQLVPMDPLPAAVAELRDGAGTVAAQVRAREWLREQLHFDLVAYDVWLGSGVLVAPNPLLRRCDTRIVSRSNMGEVIEVGGPVRRGVDLSTLTATIIEHRSNAAGWRGQDRPDALGRARATAPSEVDEVRHELVCARRGILDYDKAAWFFRNIAFGRTYETRQRTVAPPRGASSTPTQVRLRSQDSGLPDRPATPLFQIQRLRSMSADRTGDLKPVDAPPEAVAYYLFEADREQTIAVLQRLIAQARSSVFFVDPYLDDKDLQLFATATTMENVDVRALLNTKSGVAKSEGEAILAQIARMRDPDQGFGEIDIRVSTHRRFHDRFLVIDNTVWHCGHSFNKVGTGEISLMSRVGQSADIRAALNEAFEVATPFETWWANREVPVQVPCSTQTWRQKLGQWLRDIAQRVDAAPQADREVQP